MNQESGARSIAVEGVFLECVPNRRLIYTWRWEGAFADMPDTIVTAEFRAVPGGTELTLRQATLALPICVRQLSGWLLACDRLALALNAPVTPDQHGATAHGARQPAKETA